ncbi:hypothetical protein B0T13DRAFT_494322 [Neurospora crassa]|nr:hypothetical protein B0T13DRAFT_494322 [Neurospora crassa]
MTHHRVSERRFPSWDGRNGVWFAAIRPGPEICALGKAKTLDRPKAFYLNHLSAQEIHMLPKLPFETLTQIFSHFTLTLPNKSDVFPDYRPVREYENEDSELARHLQDRRTLRDLCIVCSRCRAVASPMLYHTNPQAGDIVRDLALLIAFNDEYQERDLFNCVKLGLWADLGQWLFGEAARKTRPREFDWNIRVASDIWHNDRLPVQIRERKSRTTELVNDLKRDLCGWSGKRRVDTRPHMHELIQGLLYCILRETPQVQRLLLQFPPAWGFKQNCFAKFRKLHIDNASSSPNFCSFLSSLILASNSEAPGHLKEGCRLGGQFPLQYFRSLETLIAVGPDSTFDPLRENIKSIRHLHLLDTELQPRTLGSMLLRIPQNLASFVLKQRPSDPGNQPELLDFPTEKLPTLSEVLLLKGSELRELSLILCYTHCFRNFIGSGKCLTSLPTLDRLEMLTIQMHLLFGDTRGFSANLLVQRLPPNLVELNILDEWEMDVAERELWLTRYVYHYEEVEHDPIKIWIEEQAYDDDENGERHFCHVLQDHPVLDSNDRYIEAQKRTELYSRYRMKVKAMLLDLAAQCDAGKIACQLQRADGQQEFGSLASLRFITFQIAPNKPLKLIPADENDRYDGDWPHRLEIPPVKDPMANAISEIKAGSFLCWIPYRWTNLELLKENFGIKDDEMSVRYIRDVVSHTEDESDENETDEAGEENESAGREAIGDDDENDGGSESDGNDENDEDEDDEADGEDGENDENDKGEDGGEEDGEKDDGHDDYDGYDEYDEDDDYDEDGEDGRNSEYSEGDESDENDEGEDNEEDDENDEGDVDDGNSESSEANETSEEPSPQLLTLWNTFRAIPREHFMDVTAAFARSGVRFDCFGPASEWILAIRDAAKDEVKAKALSHGVEEEL